MNNRNINSEIFIEQTRQWFYLHAGYKGADTPKAVIGISGGKDSSVVAALLAAAIGPDSVLGIMMPNGYQKDISDSMELVDRLGIYNTVINIGNAYTQLMNYIDAGFPSDSFGTPGELPELYNDKNVITNLPARLRMATLYAIANRENRRVIGTGNKSEIICGYYTLWGDGACDFDPIADLYVDEVIKLGKQLGLPDKFILKTPDDGMSGISDETKLGFKYSDVKIYWSNPKDIAIKILGEETYNKIKIKNISTNCKRNLTHIPYISIDGKLMNI